MNLCRAILRTESYKSKFKRKSVLLIIKRKIIFYSENDKEITYLLKIFQLEPILFSTKQWLYPYYLILKRLDLMAVELDVVLAGK